MPIADRVIDSPIKRGDRGEIVTAIQRALRSAGHEIVVDGVFGPITEAAVRRFQAAHGLTVDGIVGAKTGAALDKIVETFRSTAEPLPSTLDNAPWLSTARALTGIAEIPGPASNPLIMSWRDEIIARFPDMRHHLAWYSNDDIPWCGLFAAYCVAVHGYRPPDGPLWALNWRTFGVPLIAPALGCILVFSRQGGGHVGFYEGEDQTHFHVRGGNQSNKVNVARIAKTRLAIAGVRWPATARLPRVGRVIRNASEANESLNEA
jgi:uncharacterized protein (TIGR02594 family)